MSAPIDAAIESFSAIAQFDPSNATDLEMFLERLPQLLEAQASAFATLGSRMPAEMPVNQPVIEAMMQFASGIAGYHDQATEVHATFCSSHEADRNRLQNPRNGEEKWDLSANR